MKDLGGEQSDNIPWPDLDGPRRAGDSYVQGQYDELGLGEEPSLEDILHPTQYI